LPSLQQRFPENRVPILNGPADLSHVKQSALSSIAIQLEQIDGNRHRILRAEITLGTLLC